MGPIGRVQLLGRSSKILATNRLSRSNEVANRAGFLRSKPILLTVCGLCCRIIIAYYK